MVSNTIKCGFESHSGHHSGHDSNIGGVRENTFMYPQITVDMALRLSVVGVLDQECPDLRCIGRHHPALALRPPTCCQSSAPMTGRVSSQRPGARWLPSCPRRASSSFIGRAARRSRAPPSTGPVCSRSMGLDGNTPGESSSSNGNTRLCTDIQANSPEGYSTPMAGVVLTAYAHGLPVVITGTNIRGTCFQRVRRHPPVVRSRAGSTRGGLAVLQAEHDIRGQARSGGAAG
jgi:hypothetical protein